MKYLLASAAIAFAMFATPATAGEPEQFGTGLQVLQINAYATFYQVKCVEDRGFSPLSQKVSDLRELVQLTISKATEDDLVLLNAMHQVHIDQANADFTSIGPIMFCTAYAVSLSEMALTQ